MHSILEYEYSTTLIHQTLSTNDSRLPTSMSTDTINHINNNPLCGTKPESDNSIGAFQTNNSKDENLGSFSCQNKSPCIVKHKAFETPTTNDLIKMLENVSKHIENVLFKNCSFDNASLEISPLNKLSIATSTWISKKPIKSNCAFEGFEIVEEKSASTPTSTMMLEDKAKLEIKDEKTQAIFF